MNKKTIIIVSILVFWLLILGSYVIDSEIYTEIVLWVFLVPAILAVIYLLIMLYVGIQSLFNKKKISTIQDSGLDLFSGVER